MGRRGEQIRTPNAPSTRLREPLANEVLLDGTRVENVCVTPLGHPGWRLADQWSAPFFLRHYRPQELIRLLQKTGILDGLRDRGYNRFTLCLDTSDRFIHKLQLFTGEKQRQNLLMELFLRFHTFKPRRSFITEDPFPGLPVFQVEWLCLQDVRATFSSDRKQLPGQEYPGLGLASRVIRFIEKLTLECGRSALINIPEYFHNAAIYMRIFHYYSPYMQGMLESILRDIGRTQLSEVSFAIAHGCLRLKERNRFVTWKPRYMIYPLLPHLREYTRNHMYKEKVQLTMTSQHYEIDWEKFENIKKNETANRE